MTLVLGSTIGFSGVSSAQNAPANASHPNGTTDSDGISEIIVTATGHKESLNDVPYNISAISGQDLAAQGITDIYRLSQSVPGLVSADTGPRGGLSSSIIIRGLSVSSGGDVTQPSALNPTVATYVNSTPIFANLFVTDLDHVEVLRGPQGTLYGASSSAGTVRFIYNKPQFDAYTATATTGGSYTDHANGGNYEVGATANLPITQNLALRLNANYNNDAGFINAPDRYSLDGNGNPIPVSPGNLVTSPAVRESVKGVNWDTSTSLRAALRWNPSDYLDATLSMQHQIQQSGGPQADSFVGVQPSSYVTEAQVEEPFKSTVDLASLELESHLGFATLTSSTSYYNTTARAQNDLTDFYETFGFYTSVYGNSPRPLFDDNTENNSHSIVQEVRLTSQDEGAFKWVVGAFYQDKTTHIDDYQYARGYTNFYNACSASTDTTVPCGYGTYYPAITNYGPLVNREDLAYAVDGTTHFQDEAIFGESEYELLPGWKATGGLRLFRQTLSNTQTGGLLFIGPGAVATTSNAETLTGVSYKVGTSYQITPSVMAYAVLSDGQRPGGVNALPTETAVYGPVVKVPSALFTYAPDVVTNREIGIKGRLDDRFDYTLTYFNMNWSHVQVASDVTDLLIGAVINAGNANSQGVEMEFSGKIADHLTMSVGYTYDDARITQVSPPAGVDPSSFSNGAHLPGAPNQIGSLGLEYRQPLSNDWQLVYQGSVNYRGTASSALVTTQDIKTDPFTTLDASLALQTDTWTLRVYGRNLTDSAGVFGYSTINVSSGAAISRPRTIGANFTYNY